jgi:hypothetical protein
MHDRDYILPSGEQDGRGDFGVRQGEVQVKVRRDMKTINKQAISAYGVYPMIADKSAYTFNMGDSLFIWTEEGNENEDDRNAYVTNLLNGLAEKAAQVFKDDAEMQIEYMKDRILYIGSASTLTSLPITTRDTQGVPCQVGGVDFKYWGPKRHLVGQFNKVDLPSQEDISNGLIHTGVGAHPNAIKLQNVPYQPSTLGRRVFTHLRKQLENINDYEFGMNPDRRGTGAWLNVGESLFSLLTFSSLMFNPLLLKLARDSANLQPSDPMRKKYEPIADFADEINNGANTILADQTSSTTSTFSRASDYAIIKLAKAYGIIEDTDNSIEPKVGRWFRNYRRECLMKIICTGAESNFLFGFDADTDTTPAFVKYNTDKKAQVADNDHGHILKVQLNAIKNWIGGVSNAIWKEVGFIDGRVVDSGINNQSLIATIS